MREIVLDTETTGLDPLEGHRIIEIGCVELFDHMPTGKTYQVYLNPERSVSESERVHGITDAFLANKPLFVHVVDELIEFLGDAPLVMHNYHGWNTRIWFMNYSRNQQMVITYYDQAGNPVFEETGYALGTARTTAWNVLEGRSAPPSTGPPETKEYALSFLLSSTRRASSRRSDKFTFFMSELRTPVASFINFSA